MVEAAALVTPAGTAVRAVRDIAATKRGGRVLVRRAAGGVGMIAVQLAHALGAHVTALASANDATFVTSCGADQVLDYRTTTAADAGPFDVVIDTVGRGMSAYRKRLNRHGRMVTINFGSGSAMASIAVSAIHGARRIRTFSAYPDRQLLTDVARYVQSGALYPVIDKVFPPSGHRRRPPNADTPRQPGKLILSTQN